MRPRPVATILRLVTDIERRIENLGKLIRRIWIALLARNEFLTPATFTFAPGSLSRKPSFVAQISNCLNIAKYLCCVFTERKGPDGLASIAS